MKSKTEQFSQMLHLAAHGWKTALDRRLRPTGLSRSSWMMLLHVSRHDGITQSELADQLGVEAATLVRLVDRMENEGLLRRQLSATDRRVKHLHLSADGEKAVERIWATATQLRKEILSGIGEEEISAAFAVLTRIRTKVEELA